MGTFIGHAIPGTALFGFGLWWTIRILYKWWRSRKQKTEVFRGSALYSIALGRWKIDSDGLVALIAALLGILVECVLAGPMRGHPIYIHNLQHTAMYYFYGFTGVVAMLAPMIKDYVPEVDNLLYLLVILALAAEGVLFKYHLFDRVELDQLLHTLLIIVVMVTIFVMLLEMNYRESVWCSLSRAYLFLVQGTWFWQVGVILYNPLPGAKPWHPDNELELMLAALIFTMHMAGNVMLVLGLSFTVVMVCEKLNLQPGTTNVDENQLTNMYEASHLLSDEDQKVEYEAVP